MNVVIFGLSITSSWGNGHATTYRALIKALQQRGHSVTFLERDVPWYREHRDLPAPPYCRTELYQTLRDVPRRYTGLVAEADLVVVGSYVPDGAVLADWVTMNARGVTAFYDIDTPVTLARLEEGKLDYITPALIPRFDLYLSFTGGPVLGLIERLYGSPRARALHCAVDPDLHAPIKTEQKWALGYLGTHSDDRQPRLQKLLIAPARRMPQQLFAVAGPQYPRDIRWPANVERIEHLAPRQHPAFYCGQRYTLNVTRSDMVATGFSPSVRLFEAAACGVPIISDRWAGLDTIFTPGKEILIADIPEHVVAIIGELPEEKRRDIAAAARKRVLRSHTAAHRARQLEDYYAEVAERRKVGPTARNTARAKVEAVL
jgi:spore maturation protein CgeB